MTNILQIPAVFKVGGKNDRQMGRALGFEVEWLVCLTS
jgi:hypothetical protein